MLKLNTRYFLWGNSICFHKHGLIFHKDFGKNYSNHTTISARKKLKKWYTKSQQNDIIHYLKEQKYITS